LVLAYSSSSSSLFSSSFSSDGESNMTPESGPGAFDSEGAAGAVAKLLASARENLAALEIEGSAGGGAVRVQMNGERRIVGVQIEPDIFQTGEPVLLEELIVAAAADAFRKAVAVRKEAVEELFGTVPGI
jgi:DNA-binding YbaB/EbfC family protein